MIELQTKIEYLEKMYNQTLDNVNNSIDLFWFLLFGILTVGGVALYFLAKSVVDAGLDKGIKKLKNENEEIVKKLKQAEQANDKTAKELNEAIKKLEQMEEAMMIMLGAEDKK